MIKAQANHFNNGNSGEGGQGMGKLQTLIILVRYFKLTQCLLKVPCMRNTKKDLTTHFYEFLSSNDTSLGNKYYESSMSGSHLSIHFYNLLHILSNFNLSIGSSLIYNYQTKFTFSWGMEVLMGREIEGKEASQGNIGG